MTATPLLLQPERAAHDLTVPAHVSWSFGGVEFAPIDQAAAFTFSYNVDWSLPPGDLQAEVRSALQRLAASGKVLSICLSGSDSEIIAREALALGLSFELYFLDLWGNNSVERQSCDAVATTVGKSLNIISLAKEHAWTILPAQAQALGAAKPTYLCLPYLLEQIPADTVIVGGEGDPEKNSYEYSFTSTQLPIATTEVWYRQWALQNNRTCEMYFFASTPGLLRAFCKHPLLQRLDQKILTEGVKAAVWPELLFKVKTNNWSHVQGSNAEVRDYVNAQVGPFDAQSTFNVDLV